jgi:hypothetical protein
MTSLLNGVFQHKENQILFGEKAPDPFQVRKNQQASTCADGEIW